MRLKPWGAIAPGTVALVLGLFSSISVSAAPAAASNCEQFRANIVTMDGKSSTLPGYLDLRATLGGLYDRLCAGPTAERDAESWYDIDGHKLGPATAGRPAGGAFTATDTVARACATADNPSMCALLRGSIGMCPDAPDPETKKACTAALAYPRATGQEGDAPPPLPPITVLLAGKPYQVAGACADMLANLAGSSDLAGTSLRARLKREMMLQQLQDSCPQFLAGLQSTLGADPASNPDAFWPALKRLVAAGFGPPGAASAAPSQTAYRDPGFQRMCSEARTNMKTCEQRQKNMGDGTTHGRSGQAGAFGDCAALYGAVANMCTQTEARAAAPPPATPQPTAPKAPAQPAKPSDGTGSSRAPPPPPPANAGSTLSPQCQQLVSTYVAAAQAKDGPMALAGYNALKQAGGCGVLSKVDRAPPPQAAPAGPDPRFAVRGATPLSDSTIKACDDSPEACEARVRQLRSGTSPEAVAALWANAIGVGLNLGTAMAGGLAGGLPAGGHAAGGGGTNMNSIGNKPVRSTYGQGAPTYTPAPPQRPSDITGTSR